MHCIGVRFSAEYVRPDVVAAVRLVDEAGEKNEFDHVDTFVGSQVIQASSLRRFLLEPVLARLRC